MINYYLQFLVPIIVLLSSIFLIVIFSKKNKIETKQPPPKKSSHVITSQDIRAIAGDDMITTQLDLARAYIEIGKKQLAKNILDHVIKQGTSDQQKQAQQLRESCL